MALTKLTSVDKSVAKKLIANINAVKNKPTLDVAVVATNLVVGDAINVAERTTGNGGGAMWDAVLANTVTTNGDDIVLCTGVPTLALVLRASVDDGDLIRSSMYGIPNGGDQSNLTDFQSKFTTRHNPAAVYPGLIGINNPLDGSVFDFANFGGQDIAGFNPIGFVYHHYTDSRMVQMDNVGANNELLYLKNANNPTRRPDQATDFIGSAKFISLNRQESDGAGGVTGTLAGFYISKDFEMVWPMQATGVNTVRLLNNVSVGSAFWTHELKNTHEQQYLLRVKNGANNAFAVEWNAAGQSTNVQSHAGIILRAQNGDVNLSPSTGKLVKSNKPHRNPVYSRSGLPTMSAGDVGAEAYLLDGTDKYPIHYDGNAWLKTSDNTAA